MHVSIANRSCPKCSFNQPRRMPRESWIARRVMPFFGYYPWECPLCRIQFFHKSRAEHSRHSGDRARGLGIRA